MHWHRALTLAERGRPDPARRTGADRGDRWKRSLGDEPKVSARLAARGLTPSDLESLLAEPVEELATRVASPAFAVALDAILAAPVDARIDARLEVLAAKGTGRRFEAGCARLARPFLRGALRQIEDAIDSLPRARASLGFDEALAERLIAQCPGRLASIFLRTIAMEANVARLQGALSGDSPEARFDDFVAQVSSGSRLAAFYGEYPVLARLVHECVQGFADAAVELLMRLDDDADRIRALFPECDATLGEVELGMGDGHRRGRSVCRLTFGSNKLIYKPRPVAVEAHFQELLAWLSGRSGGRFPDLRALRVLDRGEYGYVEYVEHAWAATPAEVARFYARQGANLALLYALEATDLHYENLVACGEYPVLVDLEALFHGRLAPVGPTGWVDPAVRALEHSVMRTDLLPWRGFSTDDAVGNDVSAMGYVAGQVTTHALPRMRGVGTDEMHLIHERLPYGASRALPRPEVSLLDHVEDVCTGFRALYEVLLENRAALLERLEAFRSDEVRVIVTATQAYAGLIHLSLHPQFLRDGLEREQVFNRRWATLGNRAPLRLLFDSEQADLERGDIPYFSARADSRLVRDSQGRVFEGVLERSGFEATTARVQALSVSDLAAQEWFIRASLATAPLGDGRARWKTSEPHAADRPATDDELLDAARAMGERLVRTAHRDGEHASWLGLTFDRDREWRLAPLGEDLYDGLAGISLFLAHLGVVTGEPRYTDLARAALATILARARHFASETGRVPVGGFTGPSSLIYLVAHLSHLLDDAALATEGHVLAEKLGPGIDADEELDFIGGSAGCAAAVLALHTVSPSATLLALIRRAADRLAAQASSLSAERVTWPARRASAPLTGLAHGASGIGLSLLRVAAAVESGGGDGTRYRQLARGAFAYERGVFSETHQNWPDFRTSGAAASPAGPVFRTAWCHGAPGIGLSRAEAMQLDPGDPLLVRDLEAALAATRAQGFAANHCLCHGSLGNLELLLVAARGRPTAEVRGIAASILGSVRAEGPICATPLGVEIPSLMTGIAGIGYAFLRLAAPHRVPSVLTLEPPRPAGLASEVGSGDGGGYFAGR
jgi:type 2 lantibiotic biosynthesis protein LanM